MQPASESYTQPVFGWIATPRIYSSGGLIEERSNPYLVRAIAKIDFPAGEYDVLVRAKSAARLLVDGQLVGRPLQSTRGNANGHEKVPDLPPPFREGLRPLPPAHREQLSTLQLDSGSHVFRLEAVVGGKGLRAEVGQLCVAIARKGEAFNLLTPRAQSLFPLTEKGWDRFVRASCDHVSGLEKERRRIARQAEDEYWNKRHERARQLVARQQRLVSPDVPESLLVKNRIDRFIGA